MMEAPTSDMFRAVCPTFAEHEVRATSDGKLTLFGHFSVFNEPTLIDSAYEGRFVERVAPGAFTKTLSERGADLKIMWNHGRSEILPDVLIAKPTVVREDERGAYYEAELFGGLPEWLYEGLRAGVYGASFRFQSIIDDWQDSPARSDVNPEGLPERTIREAKVFEAGPVSWPAYEGATSSIRSLTDRFLGTPPDRAAPVAPGPVGAATTSNTPEADSAHLGGPTIRERRLRALQLRGVIL